MKRAFRVGALVLVTFVAWSPDSALARQYLKCLTKKVVIVDTPKGSTSSSVEESLGFWIDEEAKALMLAAGTPLTVRRFDGHWNLAKMMIAIARSASASVRKRRLTTPLKIPFPHPIRFQSSSRNQFVGGC